MSRMIRVLTRTRHVSKIEKFLTQVGLEHEIYTTNDTPPNTDYDLGLSYTHTRKIIEPELSKPKKGWVNFHPAPLPHYKGWKFIYQAIQNKETHWGVSVHYIDENYDTGPIIKVLPIELHEPPTVFHELAAVSYHFLFILFKETIVDIYNQKFQDVLQKND